MRIGDTVRIIDRGQIYGIYREMAARLGAKKWKYGESVNRRNGQTGIIKNILRQPHNTTFVLVDIGRREVVIGSRGLNIALPVSLKTKTKQKTPKKKKKIIKPVIEIAADAFNVLSKGLKSFLYKYGNHEDDDHYPYCFLLGKNRKNILTKVVRLKKAGRDEYGDECSNMVNIDGSTIAKGAIKLYKEHAIPCGLARIGLFNIHKRFSDRGMSLKEVGRMGGFILSMTKDEIKIEQCISGRKVKTYKYEIVMNGKQVRKKSKSGRR